MLDARSGGGDSLGAVKEPVDGRHIFTAPVTDIFRRNQEGFARGEVTLASLDDDTELTIEFQNKSLIARDGSSSVLASVPDLICLADKDTDLPVTTDAFRYGQRIAVLGAPAPEL